MIERNNIFVSTSSFPENDVDEIIDICRREHICGVELSSLRKPVSNHSLLRIKKNVYDRNLNFLVHNYFPPPEIPFVLNLASNNSDIATASIEHCKKAIDLCAQIKAPFYSVHAGFCFHAKPSDLGRDQTNLPRFPIKEAEHIFLKNLRLICRYADERGVGIAIENNVLSSHNLVNSKNVLLLGVESEGILRIIDTVESDNLHVLLDIGHLKVSAESLSLDVEKQIRDLSPHVIAVHLSDNDGINDRNGNIFLNSWFWPNLNQYLSPDVFYILEVYNASIDSILEQLKLIAKQMKS